MISFKEILESLEKIPNSQLGSNPGGIYQDKSGTRHYVKFPHDPEQAKVEVATSKIFEKLGINTLKPKLETSVPGKVGVKTKWDDSVSRMGDAEIEDKIEKHPSFRSSVLDLYHASALTNNWDSVGQEKDNVLHSPKGLVSVDQGGSMHFRAQGGPKEFGPDAKPELVSLLHPRRPAGQVFGHAFKHSTSEEVNHSKEKLKNLTDSDIDNIIKESGLDSKHADTLKARRDSILKG